MWHRRSPVEVFAVEHDAVQLTWSRLPAPEARIEIAGQVLDVDATPPPWYRARFGRPIPARRGGPGAITVRGLEPSTTYEVAMGGPGQPMRRVATATTLGPVPGPVRTRFATISDCHIGEVRVGGLGRLHDPAPRPDGLDPYPVRCARAAVAEAEAWGAEMLVVKGDLTADGKPTELDTIARVLGSASVPVEAALGNHDVLGARDVVDRLVALGVSVSREARAVDLPGVRLVFGHTPVRGRHHGRLPAAHAAELAALAGRAPGPAVLALHHPPRRGRLATYYPPAISWRDSSRLTRGLVAANPATVVLAGHTHRNRTYLAGGVTVAEVGATKDYPGQWAGYTVYDGGIRQVVYRIERPDAIAWTQTTARALAGVWEWWSPGSLTDRCWTRPWHDRREGRED
jgi:3',5'-cyclic AMP phosphodiesterase CpdA